MRARNRVGIGLSYRPARLHSLAEFGSLESILRLLKSLKIRALLTPTHRQVAMTLLLICLSSNLLLFLSSSGSLYILHLSSLLSILLFIFLVSKSFFCLSSPVYPPPLRCRAGRDD
jgi:hypothetical protein